MGILDFVYDERRKLYDFAQQWERNQELFPSSYPTDNIREEWLSFFEDWKASL